MKVTKAQAEAVLKTLPIGFYLGRKASVRLDCDSSTSYADTMEDSLVIAMKNVTDAADAIPASAEKYWDTERLVRCVLYHEVGHLIYTSPDLMRYPTPNKSGLPAPEMRRCLNVIEDERLERRLQGAVIGVDFPKFVKLVNGFAPNATPILPENPGPFTRLYWAVRYHVGSEKDLAAVADFWKRVAASEVVLHNSWLYYATILCDKMKELVDYFYLSQSETEKAAPEKDVGQKQAGAPNDQEGEGEPEESSEAHDTDEKDAQSEENDESKDASSEEDEKDSDGYSNENGESEDEGEDSEDGEDEEQAESGPEAADEDEKDGEDGEQEDSESEEGGEAEKDQDTPDSENNVECESPAEPDGGEDGEDETESEEEGGEDAQRDPKALESLRADIARAFDWHELSEESPVKKSLERLVKRYRVRAGVSHGEREEYATGRVSARSVALNEDKLFRDRGRNSGRGSQKVALTLWVDVSGSFHESGPKINEILKAVRRAERESAGALVVDVVAMGDYLAAMADRIESFPTDHKNYSAAVLKKTATVDPFCGNKINLDYVWCHKKTRRPGTRQFDIVVFDGACTNGCRSAQYYARHLYGRKARTTIPTEDQMKAWFYAVELEAAKIWDNPRTAIISDWSNAQLFNGVCKRAKKHFMSDGYADKLEAKVAEVLEKM